MAFSLPRSAPIAALLLLATRAATAQQPDSTRDTIVLKPVVVTAAAPDRVNIRRTLSATKTQRLLRDVPQAVTVLGSDLLQQQSMQSMADVVRYLPGVTMGQGEGHRDAPTIRGQSSTADFYINGIRDDAQYLRDLYNVERVEALKGSNAMVFGRGGGGGVINRVTKQAQWETVRDIAIEGGSFAHKRTTLDFGAGFTPAFAARVTGMIEASNQFREDSRVEREGLHPTIVLGSGATSFRMGVEHFADRRTVNRGIPSFAGRPAPSDIETFFGDPDQSDSRFTMDAADATVEHDRGNLRLRNHTRFARYDKYYQNVFPGDAVDSTLQVKLSAYDNATMRHNLFNQTDVTYSIGKPGDAVRQTWLAGVELGRQATENVRRTGYFNDSTTSYAVPFGSPNVTLPVTYRQSATDADNSSVATVGAVYAQHELMLGSHWQTVLGLRYERFHLDFTNHRNGEEFRRLDARVSPRAGVVYKPAEPLSLYATYGVSFLPGSGDQFSSLTVTSQALEPERFQNRELGVKWDVSDGVTITAAAYRLDRSNTTAPDPQDVTRLVQTGRQRTTGYEAGITGTVSNRWQVIAGFASQRARIISKTTAADAGAAVPLVPHTTLSWWNRFQVASWLATGVGVVNQDAMYAAIDNTVKLPGFTRFDMAAYLTLSSRFEIQLNVENLFNTRYYPTSHGNNNIMPGAPRSLRVSMSVD